MKVVIFAGGDQTRFKISHKEQLKVLLPIDSEDTILSNILKQIDIGEVSGIVVYAWDKQEVMSYIGKIKDRYKTEIMLSTTAYRNLGEYIMSYKGTEPVSFIYGDIYFPEGILEKYIQQTVGAIGVYEAYIGVTKSKSGSWKVLTSDRLVTSVSESHKEGFYTVGVYSILDPGIIGRIEYFDEVNEIFAQIPRKYKMGFYEMEKTLDINTPADYEKFLKITEQK